MRMQKPQRIALFIAVALVCLGIIAWIFHSRAAKRRNNLIAVTALAQRPPKLMIIWWDITKSLYASEQDVGLEWAITVISNLPAHSTYYLFPINAETQRPTPLDQGEKPVIVSPEARLLFAKEVKKRVWVNIGKLKRQIHQDEQAARSYGGVVERDKRTCLLHALNYSGTLLPNHTKDLQVEILFISDMIEDCFHQTLKGGKGSFIQLTEENVESEMTAAAKIPLNVQLKEVWITIIVPTASSETPVPRRPDMNGLQEFWRATFEKCGLNSNRYQWAIGVLPQRFNKLSP